MKKMVLPDQRKSITARGEAPEDLKKKLCETCEASKRTNWEMTPVWIVKKFKQVSDLCEFSLFACFIDIVQSPSEDLTLNSQSLVLAWDLKFENVIDDKSLKWFRKIAPDSESRKNHNINGAKND